MKKPELLAPAGDLARLICAIDYGADAVYTGGEMFSLRRAAKNFSANDLEKGVSYAHRAGRRVYLACNCFMRNDEIPLLAEQVKTARKIGVDAVIISDLGALATVKEACPDMPVHVSTQASVSNYAACRRWHELGASRIILARELSLSELEDIRARVPDDLELEVFVHGAVCVSHSGRCLISDYLASRSANRGDCAQACRWQYSLVEEKRPGEYLPVVETDTGAFLYNSRDLNMIRHIPELIFAGADSLKIEGRVKSEYYVASAVSAYRRAIDAACDSLDAYADCVDACWDETCKTSHREYFTGFFFGAPGTDGQQTDRAAYVRDWELAATVEGYDALRRLTRCRQKNRILRGDLLEALYPGGEPCAFRADMYDAQGAPISSAPHPEMEFYLDIPRLLPRGAFLRRKT